MSKNTYTYERIDKDNSVILHVDFQVGLCQLVKNHGTEEYRHGIMAHAKLGEVFKLPTVVTTNAEDGPYGFLVRGSLFGRSTFIKRDGISNPWDDDNFKNAVKSTGKNQVILASTMMDATVTSLALSLTQDGYRVFVNADACGASSTKTANDAKNRMRDAGVQVMSTLAIVGDLARNWSDVPLSFESWPTWTVY